MIMLSGEEAAINHLMMMHRNATLRNSINQEFASFEQELYSGNRFFPQTDFMQWIEQLSDSSIITIEAGTKLYRCRTISHDDESVFLSPLHNVLNDFLGMENYVDPSNFDILYLEAEIEMIRTGKKTFDGNKLKELLQPLKNKGWWGYSEIESGAPPASKAASGRINPFGISYLYAAGDSTTAALEVRPVPTQMVSIAEVEISEDMLLFDLTPGGFCKESQDDRIRIFRERLSSYYSKPNYTGPRAYLVTQYISEYIKNMVTRNSNSHFDGICFNSSLNRHGINYVLFDTNSSPKYRITSSSVFKVRDVSGGLIPVLPIDDITILSVANWPS